MATKKFSLIFKRLGAALAETEGFEPSVGVIPLRRFSKPLVSATHPRLRMRRKRGDSRGLAIDQRPVSDSIQRDFDSACRAFIVATRGFCVTFQPDRCVGNEI